MESITRTCEHGLIKREQSWIQLIISKLFSWRRNYRTRRHLRELPEHLWDDIGLEKQEIMKEIRKPFWRA